MAPHARKRSAPGGAPPVDGIVLAAGRSSRMGRAKAGLELAGATFLERAAEALRAGGCRQVVVVVSEGEAANLPGGVVPAVNPDPGSEQIASIRIGLAALPEDAAAALVLPVDAPAVRPETVRAVVARFRATGAPVVRPVHGGRPGHPTLFARATFMELAGPGLPRGAESVVERHAADLVDVPVDDAGVIANVNTPEDLARLRAGVEAHLGPAQAAQQTLDALARGDAVVVTTLLSSTAPGAGRPGARRLVLETGETTGSLGDPALDAAADAVAQAAFEAAPAAHDLTVGGESARVFVEAHLPPDELLVVGAGHIAVPLARLGALLGFQVTVLDDREEFADEARFPEAARVVQADFADPFRGIRIGRRSYVVLVTRAHRYDFDCLSRLLGATDERDRPRYIGMIGSRRRVRAALEALLAAGHERRQLEGIHAPIGLDIGAETPEEIAVSIAAELVHVRRAHHGPTLPRSELERVATRLIPEE